MYIWLEPEKNTTSIQHAPRRSVILVMLSLLLVGQAQAADKIIYIRPVPMNDDPLLKQGSKGINQAAQMYGLDADTLESQPNRESRLQQLEAAVKQGAKLVVLMGHEFKEPLASFASKAPKTRFLILDHCIDNPLPNVSCILFRETEASYLAGMEAALVSTSGKLGIIGPLDTPIRRKKTWRPLAKGRKPPIRTS
ncbi:BMP family ABC transporter substrate-binding protein [Undibacterium arcticum]